MEPERKAVCLGICQDRVWQRDAGARGTQDLAWLMSLVFHHRRNRYRDAGLGQYRLGGLFLRFTAINYDDSRQLPLWVREPARQKLFQCRDVIV